MPNRLSQETSPYLLQHADNPVDWLPWGDEALARAHAEDRPILLSIGYSACHWCHVMAHESFDDPQIARLMNQLFVCVKVDREERPDLDAVYMAAVQAMTGHGGWPLTVFLTPAGQPFYGGTYFPPADRQGMPGLPRVLVGVARAYREQREQIERSAAELVDHLRHAQALAAAPTPTPLQPATADAAARALLQQADRAHGGLGGAPKFPAPTALEFLLRWHRRTGDADALAVVELTLERMARGGICDQLGGGFHRYSTDERWLVPHFEKMLYDNALLARLYLLAYQATGKPLYRQVCLATLDYLRRELTAPAGALYATQDADTEGEEGRYYVWDADGFAAALGPAEAPLAAAYFGVTPRGNFEGRSVLHVPDHVADDPATFARQAGLAPAELADRLAGWRARLLAARERRVRPGRDEKVLAGWNGLAIRSLAAAGAQLGQPELVAAAAAAAGFVLARLRPDGRLRHSYSFRDGQARVPAFLDDHADLAAGLLALYEATFDLRWLREARSLADQAIAHFWDAAAGAFYDTADDAELRAAGRGPELPLRPRSSADAATPAGAAVAVEVLLRLAALTGDLRHRQIAERVLAGHAEPLARYPGAFGQLLCALELALAGPVEVAVVGERAAPGTRALLEVARRGYRPEVVLALREPAEPEPADVALLAGRAALGGRPTAYVCRHFACQPPVSEPAALAAALGR